MLQQTQSQSSPMLELKADHPVELIVLEDVELAQVSGGRGPNGGWSSLCEGPNGGW